VAGDRVLVVDLAGRVQREIPRPREDLGVLPDVAWSPDGRWIALVPYDFNAYGGTPTGGSHSVSYGRAGSAVTLVDAAGTGSTRGPFALDHHCQRSGRRGESCDPRRRAAPRDGRPRTR
jgi:hypothetical protein